MNFGRAYKEIGKRPRQVVALVFLSKELPVTSLSEELARSLGAETSKSVVLVRIPASSSQSLPLSHLSAERNGGTSLMGDENGMATAVVWAPSEVILQAQLRMPCSLWRTEAGFHLLTLGIPGEAISPEALTVAVRQLSRQFRYVLIEVLADEGRAPALMEVLERSDFSCLFLRAQADCVHNLDLLMRKVRLQTEIGGCQFRPVLCLTEGQQVDGVDVLAHRAGTPIHACIHGCPTMTGAAGNGHGNGDGVQENGSGLRDTPYKTDIRRLAREIGGRLVGLALSSGAAKGFAHIGVIQVLEENGIEVDVVAGSSIGAYIGALWTHGCDGKELERLAREFEERWSLWSVIDPVFPPRQGFLRGLALEHRLRRSIGHARFGDLARPLRVIASNLATLEREVFASGEVASAVHASMAVPGICTPVTIEGETYVDGGIVCPVPVEVLREMGATRVIAVNAIPMPSRARNGQHAEEKPPAKPEATARKWFRKVLPVDKQLNYFARGNIFEIVIRSVHGAQVWVADASCRSADIVLRPEIRDDRWLDVRHPRRFIELGRKVAEAHLEEIKALVAGEEVIHERELVSESVAEVA